MFTVPPQRLSQATIDRINLQGLSGLVGARCEVARLSQVALGAATAIGYARGVARARLNLLWLSFYAGQLVPAAAAATQLLRQCEADADAEGAMACTVLLGAIASSAGQPALAARHFGRAAACSAPAASLHQFMLHSQAGIDALNRGEPCAAVRSLLQALQAAERGGSVAHRVNSLTLLAAAQHDTGNHDEALPLLYEALELLGPDELAPQRAQVSARLGMCLLAGGRPDQTLALLEPFHQAEGEDPATRALLFCMAAHAAALQKQFASSAAWLAQGQAMALAAHDLGLQMYGHLVHGMLDYLEGRPRQALQGLRAAYEMLARTGNAYYRRHILHGLATVYADLGQWQTAYQFSLQYQSELAGAAVAARTARALMRSLEKEIGSLKAERDRAQALQAAQASDHLRLRHLNRKLSHQIRHATSLQRSLKEQALRDHLTGLYTRGHFETCLDAILAQAEGGGPLAVVMIKLDHFKRVNDSDGHGFGDQVLVQFARLVESQLRASDLLCRDGGEAFSLVLREADSAIAANKMAGIAARYQQLVVRQAEHSLSDGTFSAGIAAYPHHASTREGLLKQADGALCAAKQAGGARILVGPLAA